MTYAWYFAPNDNRLAHGDGREIKLGVTHIVKGRIVPYENGLHASRSILDAAGFASGQIVYRVGLSGQIVEGTDKLCARKRTYLAGGIDVSTVLRRFAADCALGVAYLWGMPAIVREYLEMLDESKRAAAMDAAIDSKDAAWAAAWNASAASAASSAAMAAASAVSAAWAAAWNASAASAAAWAATWAASIDVSTDTYNAKLEAMICAAIGYDMSEEVFDVTEKHS